MLVMSSGKTYGVVSSALLVISESSHSKKRSIKSMLNSNGSKTEPSEMNHLVLFQISLECLHCSHHLLDQYLVELYILRTR